MSREVIDDWEQREFVSSIEDALLKIVDFLNRFDKSCRFKLASVNARLSGLERKLDYVQHCLSQADPQKRNGELYPIKGTMFDMKYHMDDIRRRLEERNRDMRTQLGMLMEENSNLKGVVSLKKAREEAANVRRQATKAMLQDLPSESGTPPASPPPQKQQMPQPTPSPAPSPAPKAPAQPRVQPKQPTQPPVQPKPAQQPPQGPPKGPPAGPGGPPRGPGAPPGGPPGGPPRGPPAGPGAPPSQPRGPPRGPPAGPGAPPRGPPAGPGGPPRGPPGAPPAAPAQDNWGSGENWQVRIKKAGHGRKPKDHETCIISYVGKLSGGARNGEIFDESPANYQFVLGENIVGLEEALKTLSEGTEAKVWIPWQLAYGEEGAGDMIPPKSNLEFDLRLERILG